MRKIFILLFTLTLVCAMQAQSYKVLNVNTKDGQTQIIKLSEIESLTITEVGNETPDTPTPPVIPEETREFVDLGLPSGTLWATCNIGANSPEEYGDYFAWGETTSKSEYSWETYKYGSGFQEMTKYCTDSRYGTVDNKTVLDSSDDAATVNWGSDWCMPTKEQQDELCDNCTCTWTTKNGVKGRLFTGPNGNSIFLPNAGYRLNRNLDGASTFGCYWSSSLYSNGPDNSYYLYLLSGQVNWVSYYRYFGLSVRPVRVSAR